MKIIKLDEAEYYYPPKHYGVVDKVLVGKKIGAIFQLFYGFFAPGGYAETHSHNYGQAFFVLKGEISFTVDGEKNIIGANTAVYIPQGEMHSLMNEGKETAELLVFSPTAEYVPKTTV